jgi:hypothetical protein
MTLREYARHRGCAPSSVHKAIASGRITRGADGLIDSEEADRQWTANTMERMPPITSLPARSDSAAPKPERLRHDNDGTDENRWIQWGQLAEILDESDAALEHQLNRMVERVAPTLVGKSELQILSALQVALKRVLRTDWLAEFNRRNAEWRRMKPRPYAKWKAIRAERLLPEDERL